MYAVVEFIAVSKFVDGIGVVLSHTVMDVKRLEQGAEYTQVYLC